MSDGRISEKILSEICGHNIQNLNVGSIGNLVRFANKSPLAPLYQEGYICKNFLLDKGGGPQSGGGFVFKKI